MIRNSDEAEKAASTSDESSSAKTTKSEVLPSRGKDRWKGAKKKKARSATNSASSKRRLGGGADTEATEEQVINNHDEYKSPRDSSPEGRCTADMALESHSSPKTFHREPLPPTGDPRVDEMLECALQNLDEAGKALASLGENLEHELKVQPPRHEAKAGRGQPHHHRAGRRPRKHD